MEAPPRRLAKGKEARDKVLRNEMSREEFIKLNALLAHPEVRPGNLLTKQQDKIRYLYWNLIDYALNATSEDLDPKN